MDINIFDDRNNKSATVRIIADDPAMDELMETVLSPAFHRVDKGATLCVVCLEGEAPDISGPCIFVGCEPKNLSADQTVMTRPLDIGEFYNKCVDALARRTVFREGWSFDPTRMTAMLGDGETVLTPREAELFLLLLSRIGECVTREELEGALWKGTVGNCADVYVCYLRKKLEKIAGPGVLISVRGKGYMLKKP